MDTKLVNDIDSNNKKLGFIGGSAMIIGIIVGSGIFVSPNGITKNAGSFGLSILVWVLTGMISILGALGFAELSILMPYSAGDIYYAKEVFGDAFGFIQLWMSITINKPVALAAISYTFGEYIAKPFFMDCYISSESFKKCAAILALSCIMFVNNISVKYAINLQNIFTFSKVAALLAIIISGIYAMTTIGTSNLKNPFINSNYNILSISDAMYSGIFSFAGWNYLNLVTGEMINPKRDAPKSIILSTILVIVIYLLVIISYHTTLSIKEISNSITVAIDHAYTLSYAFAYFIPFAISLSTFGGLNGVFFTSVRIVSTVK